MNGTTRFTKANLVCIYRENAIIIVSVKVDLKLVFICIINILNLHIIFDAILVWYFIAQIHIHIRHPRFKVKFNLNIKSRVPKRCVYTACVFALKEIVSSFANRLHFWPTRTTAATRHTNRQMWRENKWLSDRKKLFIPQAILLLLFSG